MKLNKNMKNLIHFDSGISSNSYLIEDNELKKQGLILIEGDQIDSKGRKHSFSPQRLYEIAENTNTLLDKGVRIPLLEDHNKSQQSVVGDLTGTLVAEVITEENLPNPKFKELVGKVGIFVDEMTIKSQRAIQQAKENLLFTISSGLDPVKNIVREVSFTPNPAIWGCTTFSEYDETSALTFDELESAQDQFTELQTQYDDLTDKLWRIIKNIKIAEEEQLNGQTQQELSRTAIEEFMERLILILDDIDDKKLYKNIKDPRVMSSDLGERPNQSMMNSTANKNFNYRSKKPIAAFSMADMETIYFNN